MIPKDFELHERNIRFLRNKREAIVVRRWIKYNVPEFEDILMKFYTDVDKESGYFEKVVGE